MSGIKFLNGRRVRGRTLRVCCLTQGRFKEEVNFQLLIGDELIASGIQFKGRRYYTPWIEVKFINESYTESVIKLLSSIIPQGSHLMVVYSIKSVTSKALERGFPPAVTPLGFYLFNAGFTSFKDWYFAEGLNEGDIKLQGNKSGIDSLNSLSLELEEFLNKKGRSKLFLDARERALKILRAIHKSK